ncbi:MULTISPECIES: translation initiation factor 2 [Pseudomonas]|uniref:translation initiation factor 2 n=1 Tax=Pseudomonas TaxID=286 RepID=UPI00081BCD71|nr:MULTISPECIES: translation initiation factor 2 [Pseudomonas]RZI23149.1 translation initiation factor 2 [Pseudomonas orientalis]
MTSIFRVVWIVGLLGLCNAGTALAASPVAQSQPAASAGQDAAGQKPAPVKKAPQTKKKTAKSKKRAPVASKSKSAREVAQTKLPPAQLDLSLPSNMVRLLQPIGTMPKPKSVPLLPPMFSEKPSDNSAFQINGRLLSNEMKLQLRNDERRDVEGAALDFEFKR